MKGTSVYTRFVSGVLFPLHERLKHHATVAVLREMEDTQWWPAERLQALQVDRLRALLVDAGQHVPYYRNLFEQSGFDPASINSLADLQRLPFLTKLVIRANTEALKHAQANGLSRFNTGGSSGEPLVFFIGSKRVSHDVAAKWRATRWWGVDIGDPEIVLWGSPIELHVQDRVRQIRDRLIRTQLLPAFEMSEQKLDQFLATIRSKSPKMLFGYPSALSLLARHAEKRGVPMNKLGIKVAFVTAEKLYEDQRATISRVFGCPVANGYGSRDAGFIAHECPSGGMHITAEDIIVELIDADGHAVPVGTPGEIVVTHLATQDFPFIRYRTGDIAVLDDQQCTCGRGLPLLREIQGRSNDFVVASNGTIMQGAALTYLIRDMQGIEAFKIVQESLQLTRVFLVVGSSFDHSRSSEIVASFRRRLGEQVNIQIEFVDEIKPEKSGKYRYIISHVADLAKGTTTPC
ncbi:MAG: capsule biosynthesis protein CapK [Comamonadaceae bacterium CG_4_9_14_3_um_filter_60_33]|nr:MAG: capsule biosynthesis protein CapK [Comamonadaceae bacterium CG_4_10_14_3_um_filter_60_42]PJB44348.1 MAG: capsule biosynthesis protein CapK [Comamonadaceae bacterium CG_4_9_14_3_um_filter_60_33]